MTESELLRACRDALNARPRNAERPPGMTREELCASLSITTHAFTKMMKLFAAEGRLHVEKVMLTDYTGLQRRPFNIYSLTPEPDDDRDLSDGATPDGIGTSG